MTVEPGSDVLRVEGLCRVFRTGEQEIPVLRDVDLAVAPGEFTCVMGQSGSGKSTLLHVIAGLLPATSGRVFMGDTEMTLLPDAEKARLRRRRIGYVFQNFNLMPHLTAEENVTLPLRVAGLDPGEHAARVEMLLGTMDLLQRRRHLPARMSGGELQRTSIARALIARPELVLADEPTGNLSSAQGVTVMDLLREAVDGDGRSVLLVTHNPYDAARADRVLFLKDGRLDPHHELPRGSVDVAAVLDRLQELGI